MLNTETKGMTYAQAGVNRRLKDSLVGRIGTLCKTTLTSKHRPKIKSTIGGYASLYQVAPGSSQYVAACTDGVGTKLKLAFETGVHHTVGIDLVAMSINDLLCVGAEPWFFLDYFATGKLNKGVAEKVIAGVVEGCRQAECALVGGESAEMPDLYQAGEYDLGGFAVGGVHKSEILPRANVKPGDVLIGLSSSGCHSNGYSLLRKLLPVSGAERKKWALKLLTPTRIYSRELLPLIRSGKLKGLAHITGSSFLNVPRMSTNVNYEIHLPPLAERPEIYPWVYSRAGLPLKELAQTFNLGVGMVLAVEPKNVNSVLASIKKSQAGAKHRYWVLGEVLKKTQRGDSQVTVVDQGKRVVLS